MFESLRTPDGLPKAISRLLQLPDFASALQKEEQTLAHEDFVRSTLPRLIEAAQETKFIADAGIRQIESISEISIARSMTEEFFKRSSTGAGAFWLTAVASQFLTYQILLDHAPEIKKFALEKVAEAQNKVTAFKRENAATIKKLGLVTD
jgi:hypothetical protein